MAIKVLQAGLLATIQDSGRYGYQRYGVPVCGPMDFFAHAAANLLAGNPENSAAVEVGGGDFLIEMDGRHLLAVCGAGYRLFIDNQPEPLWCSLMVHNGQQVRLASEPEGGWVVLAAAGGIAVQQLLGSRSTHLRGGYGGLKGRRLQEGDVLMTANTGIPLAKMEHRQLPTDLRPPYSKNPVVDVIPVLQQDPVDEQAFQTLISSPYAVLPESDRMGYRLLGEPIRRRQPADILSEGLALGAIQVPADGQPILMMADRPTTGGYAKIGCVARADILLVAQCPPGSGIIRFRETTLVHAQERFRAMISRLRGGILSPHENANLDWAGAVQ